MTRFDVTGIGEALIRLSVYPGTRLADTDQLAVHTGGAEANVLAALSQLGHRCSWVGGLADNDLGRRAAYDLRRFGIDISAGFDCPSSRMGIYYVEHASGPLVTRVVYDRQNSCGSQLSPNLVDWDSLLDTRIVHFTGITPAISASALATTVELLQRAESEDVIVSFDVNYRSKLWSSSEAARVLGSIIESVDVLICSHRDARVLFGCDEDASRATRQLADRTAAGHVILTLGDQGAIAFDGSSMYREAAVPVIAVDRLGAGDAFAAGVLHGILNDDICLGLRYGTVLGSLAMGQLGDMVVTNLAEVGALSEAVFDTKVVER